MAGEVRTVDLMKKGLRPARPLHIHGQRVRTVDLMKKGLRLCVAALARVVHGQNRRPDEEGIKTLAVPRCPRCV